MLSLGGKRETRDESAWRARQELEPPAVRERGALDDGKAEARASVPGARVVEAGEGTFQALDLVRRDAGSLVAHLDRHFRAARERLDLHRLAGVAKGVVDEVRHRAAHRHAREAEALDGMLDEPHVLADARVVLGELA